jgi:hypothetical protein
VEIVVMVMDMEDVMFPSTAVLDFHHVLACIVSLANTSLLAMENVIDVVSRQIYYKKSKF